MATNLNIENFIQTQPSWRLQEMLEVLLTFVSWFPSRSQWNKCHNEPSEERPEIDYEVPPIMPRGLARLGSSHCCSLLCSCLYKNKRTSVSLAINPTPQAWNLQTHTRIHHRNLFPLSCSAAEKWAHSWIWMLIKRKGKKKKRMKKL